MTSQSFQLVMRSGPTPGKVFALTKTETIIGRDVGNDIVINDAELSRRHARIVQQASGFVLEDLGSTNGCFVGGQRITGPYALRPGESIRFGDNVTVLFEIAVADPDATLASSGAPEEAPPRPAARQPAYQPPAQPQVGQVPAAPSARSSEEKSSIFSNPWILGGCGCAGLIAAIAAALLAVDYFDLWCSILPFLFSGC